MYRRLSSIKVNNARNSDDENAPRTYEMLSGKVSQPTYSTVHDQSKANAPPTSTKPVENRRTQQSASPRISSDEDYLTPIDNYRYV